jgi:hypothetical protein
MKKLFESLKEQLDSEVFTDELQEEIQAAYDIAVNEGIKEGLVAKTTELEEKAAAEMVEFKEETEDRLNDYLKYAAEQYLSKNEIAIQSEVKVDIAEKVLEGVKTILKECNIEFTQDDVDAISELEGKLAEAKEEKDELIKENIDLKKASFKSEQDKVFAEKTSDLAESDVEKVTDLLEGLEFSDIEDYTRKLSICMGKIADEDEDLDEDKDLDKDEDLDKDLNEDKDTDDKVKPLATLNKHAKK